MRGGERGAGAQSKPVSDPHSNACTARSCISTGRRSGAGSAKVSIAQTIDGREHPVIQIHQPRLHGSKADIPMRCLRATKPRGASCFTVPVSRTQNARHTASAQLMLGKRVLFCYNYGKLEGLTALFCTPFCGVFRCKTLLKRQLPTRFFKDHHTVRCSRTSIREARTRGHRTGNVHPAIGVPGVSLITPHKRSADGC